MVIMEVSMKKLFIAMATLLLGAANFLEASQAKEREQQEKRQLANRRFIQENRGAQGFRGMPRHSEGDVAALEAYYSGAQAPTDYAQFTAQDRAAYDLLDGGMNKYREQRTPAARAVREQQRAEARQREMERQRQGREKTALTRAAYEQQKPGDVLDIGVYRPYADLKDLEAYYNGTQTPTDYAQFTAEDRAAYEPKGLVDRYNMWRENRGINKEFRNRSRLLKMREELANKAEALEAARAEQWAEGKPLHVSEPSYWSRFKNYWFPTETDRAHAYTQAYKEPAARYGQYVIPRSVQRFIEPRPRTIELEQAYPQPTMYEQYIKPYIPDTSNVKLPSWQMPTWQRPYARGTREAEDIRSGLMESPTLEY